MFANLPLVLPQVFPRCALATVFSSTPLSASSNLHGGNVSLSSRPLCCSVPPRALGNRDGAETAVAPSATVSVHNDTSPDCTAFEIRARNRIGLLQVITRVFKVLGLRIEKATVEFDGDFFVKRFFVVDSHGNKIEDAESLARIRTALLDAIGPEGVDRVDGVGQTLAVRVAASRGLVMRRGGLVAGGAAVEGRAKAERMFALMDGFLKNDPLNLQKDILHHVEYTVGKSRFSFDDFEAFQCIVAQKYY